MLVWITHLLAFAHPSPLRARYTFCTSCPGPLTNSAPFASCTQEVYEQFVAKDLTEAPCACCNYFCRTEGTVVVRVDDADVDVHQLLQQLKPATSAPEALPDMLRQQFNVGGELQDYLLSPHGVICIVLCNTLPCLVLCFATLRAGTHCSQPATCCRN